MNTANDIRHEAVVRFSDEAAHHQRQARQAQASRLAAIYLTPTTRLVGDLYAEIARLHGLIAAHLDDKSTLVQTMQWRLEARTDFNRAMGRE